MKTNNIYGTLGWSVKCWRFVTLGRVPCVGYMKTETMVDFMFWSKKERTRNA